ncbi:hypothetical protein MDMS009_287 [Methylophaga thiooxydans DMS010]|uniref:Uncharacterized protein n=1 Tax=Methylophaga thiooxydans DMS010 TaxID=637616 RepID=C0N1Y5_9GAMM|nr:hypothetical protein MDMS009_287 [Methylophaga thiooxydans DMS010]
MADSFESVCDLDLYRHLKRYYQEATSFAVAGWCKQSWIVIEKLTAYF